MSRSQMPGVSTRAATRSRGKSPLRRLGIVVPLLAAACAADFVRRDQEAPPRLAVVVVVDQMRADYLERFAPIFEGGLARLLREGAVFTEAHQDHAVTVTAVGHATIATGVFPASHGIVGNDYLDRVERRSVYSASDPDAPLLGFPNAAPRSPTRLRRTGIADWLKEAYPESKTVSVAIKDRSAIMLAGRDPAGVYWYLGDARGFVTSEYYADEYPEWLEEFDAPERIASYWARGWDRALPEYRYLDISREDDFEVEGEGGPHTFPYRFPEMFPEGTAEDPGEDYFGEFPHTPYADEVVIQLARAAVVAEDLGSDDSPDLLMIGCSAGDYIGHRWGPYSQEVQDYYFRLDAYLGELFGFLDQHVGEGRWTVTLSADHGVAPAPEESARRGLDAERISSREHLNKIREILVESLEEVDPDPRPVIRWLNGAYILPPANGDPLREDQMRALRAEIERRLEEIPYVDDVFTIEELGQADLWGSGTVSAFLRSYDAERSPEVVPHYKPYYLIGATPATHGSAYGYDSHVPLVFMGGGVSAQWVDQRVRTVDIAPTLAGRLGIEAPVDLDGRALRISR